VYEVFKVYLDNKIFLTQEEHEYIRSRAVVKILRKRQYLLQEGNNWNNKAFVSKGLLRTYSVDKAGFEHVISFAMENWWIGDRESLLFGEPSRFNIDAIEDSGVVVIEKPKFDAICREIPSFNNMVHTILERSFIFSQNRIHDSISISIEERYLNFVQRYPSLAARVPLNMLASYLGVARETLSRIRHKTAKRSLN